MKRNCFTTEVLSAFKLTLSGLPSFSRLVMYELLSYCDYPSGTILINAIDDLATHDFQVNLSSQYAQESINSEMLREAFYLIQEERPDDFKITTSYPSVKIDMPFLRELHQKFYPANQPGSAEGLGDEIIDHNKKQHLDNTELMPLINPKHLQKTEPSTTRKPPIFITCACGIRSQKIG